MASLVSLYSRWLYLPSSEDKTSETSAVAKVSASAATANGRPRLGFGEGLVARTAAVAAAAAAEAASAKVKAQEESDRTDRRSPGSTTVRGWIKGEVFLMDRRRDPRR